ncbi:PadR family transcriptional regulator [Evansella sp. AB-P1]|uniref:PadR family transcriptional regulator n=1 Tax=Evansella sp. AB-P1 TaxID=3037653 RepID=UPI00241E9BCA|nr:PadR family transcriptional regulator [Evansella sp. AB-P1]MDG5786006.1 PadR family transcriptional regulator [Evansella sp. AB-P1]
MQAHRRDTMLMSLHPGKNENAGRFVGQLLVVTMTGQLCLVFQSVEKFKTIYLLLFIDISIKINRNRKKGGDVLMTHFKKRDILTILAYVSRKKMSKEELIEKLSNKVFNLEKVMEHLDHEKLIVNKDGVFSISEKGLKEAHLFYENNFHQRKTGREKKSKRSSFIQKAILLLLKEGPRHGYEIMKLLEERSGEVYSPSAGTIYPALQDLLERDYISIDEQTDKKVYSIAAAGLELLSETVQDDEEFWENWRIRLLWKQSKEAASLREEMEKYQLEFLYAVRHVMHDPSLTEELAEIIKNGREALIQWSEKDK